MLKSGIPDILTYYLDNHIVNLNYVQVLSN